MSDLRFAVILQPVSEEDGGGYAAIVPDLPGCMSDGETAQAALVNVVDAIACWIEGAHDLGHSVPAPGRRIDLSTSPFGQAA